MSRKISVHLPKSDKEITVLIDSGSFIGDNKSIHIYTDKLDYEKVINYAKQDTELLYALHNHIFN